MATGLPGGGGSPAGLGSHLAVPGGSGPWGLRTLPRLAVTAVLSVSTYTVRGGGV